ncbi:hypothetical protein C1645_781076 [Glomus cerebriforme]|uniref:Uncharacterized protein n=1 Tax=Glomus cerebriforme TaxID=658196 RepID=A0A397SJN1_9GLOM|nr:hypothetical protein C1645_781076 [Glomus cerebriforme]
MFNAVRKILILYNEKDVFFVLFFVPIFGSIVKNNLVKKVRIDNKKLQPILRLLSSTLFFYEDYNITGSVLPILRNSLIILSSSVFHQLSILLSCEVAGSRHVESLISLLFFFSFMLPTSFLAFFNCKATLTLRTDFFKD